MLRDKSDIKARRTKYKESPAINNWQKKLKKLKKSFQNQVEELLNWILL